jgi:serine/threonine-protein kinase RsbW
MDSRNSSVELKIASSLEHIDLVENITNSLALMAGCTPDQMYFIQMAVREIVTNAIQHGNHFDLNKQVSIVYEFDPGKFEVHVRDQGDGFDYDHLPDPCDPANLLKSSGRGIFLVRSFMDDFSLRRIPNQGTEVRFVKRLSGS